MTIVPNTLWSWKWKPIVSLGSMNIPFALQAFLQNQVDQLLKETHQRDWTNWTHEDLRLTSPAFRLARKQGLLSECPGMLSGLGAVALNEDAWSPMYVLSITIARSALGETSYSSDFRIINVVWEHTRSGILSVTLFNNHLDEGSDFRHIVTEGLSTKRRSQRIPGRRGSGFLCAVRAIMIELYLPQNVPIKDICRSVALRVGDSVGEYGWSEPKDGQRELMLRQYELRPLSLANVQSVPGIPSHLITTFDSRSHSVAATDFAFPFDQDAPRAVREFSKEKRVAAIYRERFLLHMSQKTIADVRATEPAHERPLVQADEVLVTVSGLSQSCTPETLFSTVWSIFPPQRSWSIPLPGHNLCEFVFYKPTDENGSAGDASKPRFFHRGYLIPSGPPLNNLGVDYLGDLDLTDGHAVVTTSTWFSVYLLHLGLALNMAFRTMPELATELAVDILTDSRGHPHSFGRVLSASRSVNEEGMLAYRTAFETAWRRLDPAVADPALAPYPYAAGDASEEKMLIERLGMRPVPVQPHVQHLLEKTGAYPPVKTYAETLLLSSPGTLQQPYGTENLVAALSILFPLCRGDVLSLRRYDYPYPRVVWDVKAEIFVMSASVLCEEHAAREPPETCLCWVGVVLQEAVASWRSKTGASASGPQAISDTSVFHALLQCTQPAPRAASSSSVSSIRTAQTWDDGEIEYCDPPTPSETGAGPAAQPQAAHSLAYPSPVSPTQPRRRMHARSPAFVITTLPSKRKPYARAPLARDRIPVDTDAASLFGDDSRATPPRAPQDLADLSDIVGDFHRRMDGRVRAIQTHHARERGALQDELAHAHATVAELRGTLAAKEETLAVRERALEDKDETLRARDGVIRELSEALRLQERRADGLQADIKRKEEREKRQRERLHSEAKSIQQRLLDMFRAQSEREESVLEVVNLGDTDDKDDEYEVEGGEGSSPVSKRARLL
ncbi:hypothetical protein TRAPUB_11109 [Trametes pubescens]|uniref:Uncharacterized protein n=1 Tax=Trametes pubescens TaxID=154538 RepID=A0A1M2VXJ4_TRAPU|nr:hypothetical protein TRAPUB_11109 [Trametes pubescens]